MLMNAERVIHQHPGLGEQQYGSYKLGMGQIAVRRYAGRHRFVPEPVARLPMGVRAGIVVAFAMIMTVAGLLVSGGSPDRPAPRGLANPPHAAGQPAPAPAGPTPTGSPDAAPPDQLRQRLRQVTSERTAVEDALARIKRLETQLTDAGLPPGSETTTLQRNLENKDTALAAAQRTINQAMSSPPS
jgi:hypothetical protein